MQIYKQIGRIDFQSENLLQALDGYINIQDRHHSDSLLNILRYIPREFYENLSLYQHCQIIYANKFLPPTEIKEILDNINTEDLNDDLILDITWGYVTVQDKEKAMEWLKKISHPLKNRVKYLSIKSEVQELNEDYQNALTTLRAGIEASDSIIGKWTGDDRLFAKNKFKLEKRIDLGKVRTEKLIFSSIITILALVIISLGLFLCLAKSKISALKNEKLLLNQKFESLFFKRKLIDVQGKYDQINVEFEELLDESKLIKNENKHYKENNEELLKVNRIKEQEEYQYKQEISEILKHTEGAIQKAEELRKQLVVESTILNELIASHITSSQNNLIQYNQLLDLINNRKDEFLIKLRERMTLIYPNFMQKLDLIGLSEIEIKYVCLYIIGLRPKEIGEFLQSKRFYIVSSEIRTKFGLDKNNINLGSYIKSELKKEE